MPTLPSGLPDQVDGTEDIARFLTQSGHFKSEQVKPSAFLPSQSGRETSVSRHGADPNDRLWQIGFEAAGDRTLYGAALLKCGDVRNADLDVLADEPPLRHAAIRNWPCIPSDPDLQKAKQKELALLLCSAAGKPLLR